jgi:hypothetical protein
MTTHAQRTLDSAVAALERTTGIEANVHPPTEGQGHPVDAILEVQSDRRKYRFGAEVKTVDRFETPAMLQARSKARREPPLLVAPYITREIAERCRQLRLPFIDTAGNVYLEAPGLLVYVVGQARLVEVRQGSYRALNPAGLKLTFALLCRPELLNRDYRTIAGDAGVALGTVSSDMKDLEARGFFSLKTHPHVRTLLDPTRMLEEWVTHYPVTLRPKLLLGRFQAEAEGLQRTDIRQYSAFWGGEPAAERLTGYLRPASFTIYTGRDHLAKLVAGGRMRAAANGNVEILERFWKFAADVANGAKKELPDVVPPILAYADLLATRDSRNAEAARIIYARTIEKLPAFRFRK